MKKLRVLCFVLCALLLGTLTASATTVQGTVKDASGTAVETGTLVVFRLTQEGIAGGVLYVNQPQIQCKVISGGVIKDFAGTGNCTVQGNDTISPAGTRYEVRITGPGGTEFLPQRRYNITGATWDIGTATPDATATVPATAYQQIQDDGVNLTKQSTLNLGGGMFSCADNQASARTDCILRFERPESFDFIEFINHAGIIAGAIGAPSGQSAYISNGDVNHPGSALIETGVVANTGNSIVLASTSFNIDSPHLDPYWSWETIWQATDQTSLRSRVGFFTSQTEDPPISGGYYFQYDSSVDGNWHAVNRSGGVETGTNTDTGIAVAANTWYVLRMEGDATSTRFYINGVLKATHTANRAATGSLRHGFQAITLNTTEKFVELDYIAWYRKVVR